VGPALHLPRISCMSLFSPKHDFTHPDQFELLKHSSLARGPSRWLAHQLTSCPHVSARMSYQYQPSPWNVLSCSPQSYMTTAEDKTETSQREMWPASFDLFSTNLQNSWKLSSNEGTATQRDRLRLRSYWGLILMSFADLQQGWRYTSGGWYLLLSSRSWSFVRGDF
jgi:hypothetical protein